VTPFLAYRTLWHGALRRTVTLPGGFYLLPFSSWFAASHSSQIRVPELPKHCTFSVDSGAYRYRDGQYPYHPLDYIRWCQALNPSPEWVVMPDWFAHHPGRVPYQTWSLGADMYGPHPGSGTREPLPPRLLFLADLLAAMFQWQTETRVRQIRTSLMAYTLWDHYRDAVACWVPVIQGGGQLSDYIWHTRLLLPLIREMQEYYGPSSGFRVGIGALAGRSPREIVEIVTVVASLVPTGTPLHLFVVGLRDFERSPASFPSSLSVLSVDSSNWNGQRVRGKVPGRKAWQESGLTQLQYGYVVALPAYEEKLQAAWARVQRLPGLPVPSLEADQMIERFFECFQVLRDDSYHIHREPPDSLIAL
jgi:hypothetical protein